METTVSLLKDPPALYHRIVDTLHRQNPPFSGLSNRVCQQESPSSVLFLLGPRTGPEASSAEICVILNKRSALVRQPGDLCCPGGGISFRYDRFLSRFLDFPGSPLRRWPHRSAWKNRYPEKMEELKLLFTVGLREGFEEMRLNPLRVRFLGPLPTQQLAMFQREIYPLACWVPRQRRFSLNWEVEKLVYIPLGALLSPKNYACCRIQSHRPRKHWNNATEKDFPCFIYGSERLWGATYRITMTFMKLVFQFTPPEIQTLPVIDTKLQKHYTTGTR